MHTPPLTRGGSTMVKPVTYRQLRLPSTLDARVREFADKHELSINRAGIRLLERGLRRSRKGSTVAAVQRQEAPDAGCGLVQSGRQGRV